MEHKRRRFFSSVTERKERLERIAKASPPASTFEGHLQRWRDDKAVEEGRDTDASDDDLHLDGDPDVDTVEDVDDELLAVQVAAPRRGKPLTIKPAHRQAPPPSDTRGESWWTKTTRQDHSATANQELGRMSKSKEGRLTAARIIE